MKIFIKFKFILIFLFSTNVSFCCSENNITLLSPQDNTLVTSDTLEFKWNCSVNVEKYLLIISLEDKSFKREIIVFEDNPEVEYTLKEIKKYLKKSGIYTWQIRAIWQGEELNSPIRVFKVNRKNQEKFLPPLDYIYALELQVLKRNKTTEYYNFLENVTSKYSFTDYKSLGIVFRQKGVMLSSLDFLEKIYLLSQTGMGFFIKSRMNLDQNVYFSFYPAVEYSALWFSTGINRYSSKSVYTSLGFDLELMPRRFIALSARYVPHYKIHYLNQDKELKVFKGKGWQMSLEFVISNNIIRKFNLFGIKIDLERLPIRSTYNRIKDSFSNRHIETQMIYFIYLI